MKRRVAALIGVLVLAVFPAPSSAGVTAAGGALYVSGVMQTDTGFGYSCTGTFGTFDPSRCPIVGTQPPPVAFAWDGTALGTIADVRTADGHQRADVGIFSVSASGSLVGTCDLWSASVSGIILTTSTIVGTHPWYEPMARPFTASIVSIGAKAFVGGSTSQGETIFGQFNYVPDAVNGSSCTNVWAKRFIFTGVLTLAGATV